MAKVHSIAEDCKSTSLFMGQILSLLVKRRAAAEKVNEKPKTSQEDICSSLPTTLQLLPAEIILMISNLLPLSGIMALNYTCRALSIKLGVSTQGVLGEPSIVTNIPTYAERSHQEREPQPRSSLPEHRPSLKRLERLELLCMLDRDGQLPQQKAVCSSCATTHDRVCFSEKSLNMESSQRRCLGSTGSIWICPHWIIDYSNWQDCTEPRKDHECGDAKVCVMHGQTRPTIKWPILNLTLIHDDTPSQEFVTAVLRGNKVAICPHWRMCDSFVTDLYSPNYNRCSSRRQCRICGTSIYFSMTTHFDSGNMLQVVVERRKLEFTSCTDPAWIAQLHDPTQFQVLERAWLAATGGECNLDIMF